jgi:predicted dithiol-disulfide oxidoreductase (DUF899 family)
MATNTNLRPAAELAALNGAHYPNESAEYREARNALLAEEIEVRRHLERLAEMRRQLPPGGAVTKDYRFDGENGPARFADLFGDKETLVAYSYMYGTQRKRPCPMCTSLMSAWEGEARDIEQRVGFVMIARSPIERLVEFKKERGWRYLKLYSDMSGDYTRDYVNAEDADIPAYNVFTRRDGTIRHFWSSELSGKVADPGQDSRGAPELMPIWTILDSTPEGRGTDWYPKLEYPS